MPAKPATIAHPAPKTLPIAVPHLLVVDDDARLRSILRRYLQINDFRVTEAATAGDARAEMALFAFDTVILDVMMPGETGTHFLSEIRRHSRVPVILLTAMAEAADRIDGLERGADDFLAKPFEPRELVLRLHNILARVPQPEPQAATAVVFGDCRFDLVRGELFRDGRPVRLAPTETALLATLAAAPGQPLSREALGAAINLAGGERTIDVQMTRLRRKIERDPRFPRYLQTMRGIGYVLKPD